MTTVAQLIAHLRTLPQDAIVQCLGEDEWITDYYTWKNLDIDRDVYVRDLRGNKFFKPDDIHYNKVVVNIGQYSWS